MTAARDPAAYRARLRWPSLGLGLLEALVVLGPLVSFVRFSGPQLAMLRAGALVWVPFAVLLDRLLTRSLRAPLDRALARRRAGVVLSEADARAAYRVLLVAPRRIPWIRAAAWFTAVGGSVLLLRVTTGFSDLPLALTIATLHSFAAAVARGFAWERALRPLRSVLLPDADSLRLFGDTYFQRIIEVSLTTGALAVGAMALFIYYVIDISAPAYKLLEAYFAPTVAALIAVWYLIVRRLPRFIERYLAKRDEGDARQAYREAQGLPLRLAACRIGTWLLAALALALQAHAFGVESRKAALMFAMVALITVGAAQFEILWHRANLRPLLQQLVLAHGLSPGEVAPGMGLRQKMLAGTGGIVLFACGLSILWSFLQARTLWVVGLFLVSLGVLSVGLVLVLVRDLTEPVRLLERRAIEMTRGDLAGPVLATGEADEIGRLTFAFEQMRRALQQKLEGAESLSVALEKQVKVRTEDLERANRELRTTLDTLRHAQDQLVRSEKLASMGRLVAGIAHEINNPVNAMVNSLAPLKEALVERLGSGDLPSEVRQMLDVIGRGAARTKDIVQALHSYARGDTERIAEVDLYRLLDESLELLRHHVRQGIAVEKQYGPVGSVRGYAGQLQQVFMNLLTNAAQAIAERPGPGGAVTGRIRIETARLGRDVIVKISDDGPGIPKEVLPVIFDPFFTTKEVGKGSGLGLSIVHGIVERHGGRIDAFSEVGQGATFQVTLPQDSVAG